MYLILSHCCQPRPYFMTGSRTHHLQLELLPFICLYCLFPLNQWSSRCHAPHCNTGHSWLNSVIMECAWYYLQWSLSFKAFVDWWVFVLQQFPGHVSVHSENSVLHGTQVKISIIALIAANFLLNGPRCHISQQAGGQEHLMVAQMEMKESKKKKKTPSDRFLFSQSGWKGL